MLSFTRHMQKPVYGEQKQRQADRVDHGDHSTGTEQNAARLDKVPHLH